MGEYDPRVKKNVAKANVKQKETFDRHNRVCDKKTEVGDKVRIRNGAYVKKEYKNLVSLVW